MGEVNITGPKILWTLPDTIPIIGGQPITETMRNAWIVMIFITVVCVILTRNMEKVPKGKQALAEKAVMMVDNLVETTMGPGCQAFAPYIATLLMFSFCGSMASLFFMRPVTGDLNTTLGWALITFALITFNKIKYQGFGGYLKSFTEPVFVMTPLNLLSEIATPVAMSFRHFGNIAGGLVISTLLLAALGAASSFLPIPLLQVGLPGVLSLYFDLFTSAMQAFIFSMLTMAYVGDARSS